MGHLLRSHRAAEGTADGRRAGNLRHTHISCISFSVLFFCFFQNPVLNKLIVRAQFRWDKDNHNARNYSVGSTIVPVISTWWPCGGRGPRPSSSRTPSRGPCSRPTCRSRRSRRRRSFGRRTPPCTTPVGARNTLTCGTNTSN